MRGVDVAASAGAAILAGGGIDLEIAPVAAALLRSVSSLPGMRLEAEKGGCVRQFGVRHFTRFPCLAESVR